MRELERYLDQILLTHKIR